MTQPYDVLQAFAAKTAISGREYQFKPGEIIACDKSQQGQTIVIETDGSFFLVDRSVFDACCKFRNEGSSG